MLKKSITYEDFNGETVTEDFYFNLSTAELVELEMSHKDGLVAMMQRIIEADDRAAIIAEFKKIILKAYGQKSADGRRFIKNQRLREEFESTEAYSVLFMQLVTDAEAAAEFVNGIVPKDLLAQANEIQPTALQEQALAGLKVSKPEPETQKLLRTITRKELEEMTQEDYEHAIEQMGTGEARLV